MHQYYLNDSIDLLLDTKTLGRILADYQTRIVPVMHHRKNYYDGKQDILLKTFENSDRQPAKIVCNMCYEAVNNYVGYGVGIAPRVEATQDNEILQDVLNYNDFDEACVQLFTDGLIFGRSGILMYIDSDGATRFTAAIDPRNLIPVYDDTIEHNLKYCIRFYQIKLADEQMADYYVEVYSDKYKYTYKSGAGFVSFDILDAKPHFFNQVPLCLFSLNKDEVGLCDQVFSLQDALNDILSDRQDEADQLADCSLVLTGAFADSDDLDSIKKNKVIMLDKDSTAEYLVKNTNGSEAESLVNRYETKIREIIGCPNFADESFGTSSGIAIRYKLLQMENNTAGYVNNMKKTLQKLVELIGGVEQMRTGDAFWRDVKITFTRNLPVDETSNAQVVSTLRGIVSDETLLGLLPFVEDPAAEVAKANKESEDRVSLYNFSNGSEEDADESEDESEVNADESKQEEDRAKGE